MHLSRDNHAFNGNRSLVPNLQQFDMHLGSENESMTIELKQAMAPKWKTMKLYYSTHNFATRVTLGP